MNQKPTLEDPNITFMPQTHFFTELETIFTTPTTVSEASGDAEQIELEADLLTCCKNKERFITVLYSLKDKKLDIMLPYLKLLHLFKNQKEEVPMNVEEVVETLSEKTLTESKESDLPLPRYFNWDFPESCDGLSMEPVVSEPEEEQEMILLDDLLNILLGYDGKYIKANIVQSINEKRTFRISSHIKPSFRGLVENILPVASAYSNLVRFINENTSFSAGKVNQALAAALSGEIVEYMNNVLNLEYLKETQGLNLHIVWCALQDITNKMRIMAKIIDYINKENAKGASVLNILHRCTSNALADPEAEKMCLRLTKAASFPYFEIIEKWIYKGQIDDPYDEFMIVEKKEKGKVNLDWEDKFELRQKCVPFFLKHDDKLILNSGRYMYAIHKSLPVLEIPPCAEMENIQYENIELVYLNMIRRGYDFANGTLLALLDDERTIAWLRTAKSFFSLEYDDVFYNIIFNCCDELKKPTSVISVSYLQELVENCIRSCSLGALPFTTEYSVKLEKCSLMSQMKSFNLQEPKETDESLSGLEALTFTTSPPWPVCIIFNTKTLTGYQMLFRHIFYMKYVYMKLTSTRLGDVPKTVHLLKYSMTVFVQTCLSYMTVDTIQTLWDKLENEYMCVDSVIELVQLHNNYMYHTLMGCMLASSDVFQYLRVTLGICLKFCVELDMELERDYKSCLVILLKAASREACWSSFIKALIPTFTDIPELVELNNLCLY
ncbi:gamma-tubulin complex component 2 [Halyomorpha halys]|uniref:gamma-tubulin complex component 2 n=1 Tax=Halyomorpha halys TaxID=286706 RepID=UPI0006D4D9F1|nr:gamma-tubulin complex component 2-like [Halyomorpha halys]